MNNQTVNNNEALAADPVASSGAEKEKSKLSGFDINFIIQRGKVIFKIAKTHTLAFVEIVKRNAMPIFQKNKWACIACAALIVFIIFILLILALSGHHHEKVSPIQAKPIIMNEHSQVKASDNPIHDELDDISAKLANIEQKLGQRHAYVNLDEVRKSLGSLNAQVGNLANHSNQIVTAQIKSSTKQLQGQLSTIKQELAVITAKKTHHKMMNVSALPFKVMSIDNIQQHEVVTIRYANRILPIDIGDSIANWALVSANTVDQKAQFRTTNNNYVLVDLNELNEGNKENV